MTARNPQELAAFLESLEDYVPTVSEMHVAHSLICDQSVNTLFGVC